MINNIQALRAFAAINVVLFHIIGAATSYSKDTYFLKYFEGWGANGVDLFFVISGFVMLHIQLIQKRSPYEFFKNRVIRIVPIYWIITIFVVVLYFIFPSVFREMIVTPLWAITSLIFSSSVFAYDYPILQVGWTLEYEMLFYSIFAIGLAFNNLKLQAIFVVTTLAFVAIITEKSIILEFLFGMLVAYFYKTFKLSSKQGLLIFIFGVILLIMSIFPNATNFEISRAIKWGVPSFFIVFGLVYYKQTRNRFLVYLGDASYSIYLIQILTIPAFYKFSKKLFDNLVLNGDILAFLCLATCIIAGCFFHSLIEKNITTKLKNI